MLVGAPDYFKRFLLYGLYEGAAVPLACDEQGRLVFVQAPVSPLYGKGTILLHDTFDSGLVYVRQYTDGEDAAIALDGDEACVGSYSCRLTGGKDDLRLAYIKYHVHPSNYNKLGVEVSIRISLLIETFELKLACLTGTRHLIGRIRYNLLTQDWEIYDYDASAYVAVVEDEAYHGGTNDFVPVKLVIDLDTETYHKFSIASETVDITAYNLYAVDSDTSPHGAAEFHVVSIEGTNGYVIIDNVIVTQDES